MFIKIYSQYHPDLANSDSVVSLPASFHFLDINIFGFSMDMIDNFLCQSKDSVIRYPFLFSEAVCLFAEFNLPHNTIPVRGEFFLFVLMVFCSPFLSLFVL